MASFSYKAIDQKSGKEKKGSIEARSKEKVVMTLKGEGLIPLEVKEESVWSKDIEFSFASKVKTRDLSVFCRQFVSIVSAGVSIINALDMLSEQTENKQLRKAIKETKSSIEKGETLSDAMRTQTKVFPSMLINMVEAGEASGSLEVAFTRMAIQFEKETKLKSLMAKALIYPIILGIVAVAVIIIMLVKIVPTFIDMFEQLDTKLPAITLAVINASNFMSKYWHLIVGLIAIIVIGIKWYSKTPAGSHVAGMLGMKLPLFGKLTVKSASAGLARTLSTLFAAGIPMISALEITAKTMKNKIIQDVVINAIDEVGKGVPLSEPLKQSNCFPPMVYHMINIGEETGALESMLDKLADYYEEEVESATEALMAALEPMIIIILALIIVVIIMAIMTPMTSMYDGLDNL